MATIEIMTPWSESCTPTTFLMEGEHDVGSGKLRPAVVPNWKVKCAAKPVGGAYGGEVEGELFADNTWSCEMTLAAENTYDLRAKLYEVVSGSDVERDSDEVITICVRDVPAIVLDPIPDTDPATITGTFDSSQGSEVLVQVVRYRRKPPGSVMRAYRTIQATESLTPAPPHFTTGPVTLRRPTGAEYMFVVVGMLTSGMDVTGRHTRALRRL